LAELARASMQRLPQVLLNVAAARPADAVATPAVQAEVAAVELELGAHGRVLLRASGTEPLVRVMVEAADEAAAHAAARRLCAVVERALVSSPAPE
jgi:phosphoglucosamine mutase